MSIGEPSIHTGFEAGLPVQPSLPRPQNDGLETVYVSTIIHQLRVEWPQDIVFDDELLVIAADKTLEVAKMRAKVEFGTEDVKASAISQIIAAVTREVIGLIASMGVKKVKTA